MKAASQWGRERITQEKVDRLLTVVKMNDYKYKDLYISILERWSKGDFSNAVDDHNKIWNCKVAMTQQIQEEQLVYYRPRKKSSILNNFTQMKNR